MPGPQIKNWDQYHALRDKGMPKARAAAIVNGASAKRVKNRQAYTNLRVQHRSAPREMAAAIVNARHDHKRLPRPLLAKARR